MQVGPDQDTENLKVRVGPVIRFIRRFTPNCKETTRLMSEAMDRPLPFATRLKLRFHMLICEGCARYRNQLLSIRRALHRHPDKVDGQGEARPAALSAEAKARLVQALKSREQ
jgi:hypothetical protein